MFKWFINQHSKSNKTHDDLIKIWDKLPTFKDYLNNTNDELNIIVNDVEIDATLYWDKSQYNLTEEGEKYYKELLDSKCEKMESYNDITIVYIYCENEDLAEDFVYTCAGYTDINRYNKLFVNND